VGGGGGRRRRSSGREQTSESGCDGRKGKMRVRVAVRPQGRLL
jgi:hypothetical protein